MNRNYSYTMPITLNKYFIIFLFFFFLWQLCTLSRHCLVKWPFCIFLFFFLPIFDREFFLFLLLSSNLWLGIFSFLFFCFPPIFDRGIFSFFFLFLFEAHSQLNSKWSFFFWETLLFFLLRVKVKIPILGQGLWSKGEVLAQKGLWKARHDAC